MPKSTNPYTVDEPSFTSNEPKYSKLTMVAGRTNSKRLLPAPIVLRPSPPHFRFETTVHQLQVAKLAPKEPNANETVRELFLYYYP